MGKPPKGIRLVPWRYTTSPAMLKFRNWGSARDGVHVDHDLDPVPVLFLASLHVFVLRGVVTTFGVGVDDPQGNAGQLVRRAVGFAGVE